MAIYTPYFYIIQDIRNGMYYAGAKWGRGANPETFMVDGGYRTSSCTIKNLIADHGVGIFVIRKVKVFNTAEETYAYETRFLKRVNARDNPNFYNCHNNDNNVNFVMMETAMLERYGVRNASQSEKIKAMKRSTVMRNHNGYTLEIASDIREKYEDTMCERYGVLNPMHSTELKQRHTQSFVERHGVDHVSKLPDVKGKIEATFVVKYGGYTLENTSSLRKEYESTMIERYGVDNPMKSCEIRDKVKKTNMQRHGVENPSQLENVKQKKKQTLIQNHGNHPNKGRIVITDGINTMFCQKDEIPTGWWKGRPNSP